MPSTSPTLPRRALLPVLLAMALTTPPLPATTLGGDRLLLSLSGSGTFGWEVDALAHVDGDGGHEIIVPSPFLDANRVQVEVFSGSDGRVLHRLPGPAAGVLFGVGIEDAGDSRAGLPRRASERQGTVVRLLVRAGLRRRGLDPAGQRRRALPAALVELHRHRQPAVVHRQRRAQ